MKMTVGSMPRIIFKAAVISAIVLLLTSLLIVININAGPSGGSMLLLTQDRGVMVYEDGDWESYNSGLPGKFTPLRIESDSIGNFYLLTLRSGLYTRKLSDSKWRSISSPEFLSRKKTGRPGEYRKISAFAVNDSNPDFIAAATKHSLYISKNRGETWEEISLKGLHRRNYITSICIKGKENLIYAGTSFKGIFRYTGNGFVKYSSGIEPVKYSTSVSFFEEINYMASSDNGLLIAAGMSFGGGLYISDGKGRWKDIHIPLKKDSHSFIQHLLINNKSIEASTDEGIFTYDIPGKNWKKQSHDIYTRVVPGNVAPLSLLIMNAGNNGKALFLHLNNYSEPGSRLISSSFNRRGIYSSAHTIKRSLDKLIKTIKKSNLNSIVIDMKDDFGYLYYPTKNRTALESGAARKPVKIKEILDKLKKNGIYTIARVVVFKDRALFRAYSNRYAILNWKTGKPWKGTPGEYWVDPHSAFVQKYNSDIAVELQELGFDEIQFDYIRFPTDGPTQLCRYRYRDKKDIYKSEVLSDFLSFARSRLKIPVSVDIYGFNAWYNCGNWMGQDIEEFSRIVDVICPMDYPSHFGNRFMMNGPRSERPYRIIRAAGLRANRHANNRSSIRPYLQAFNLHSPTWSPGYITGQVNGALESRCSGFTFWNARTDYIMVEKALSK